MARIRLRRAAGRPHCPLCRVVFVGDEAGYDCAGCATRYHEDCADELGGCSTLGCPRLGAGPGDDDPADQRWRARARRYREGARARRSEVRRLREEHATEARAQLQAQQGGGVSAGDVVEGAWLGLQCLDCLSFLAIFSVLAALGLWTL
ncbi:MAG: hypothetical protein M9894_25280 [Planctomycetes bacterium]|nr:hypothetical protein [Planctomycetota bacterium]